eukprot:gnl/MRDRNA2_/MRDRNA2_27521_c0_seq1.p1 gnl/MRDRNA2_/MRDRNA2_27521_c0~~gnl/MRDRNA2_/MRDRNA2_27521_c0_seq1.p1  ORF type:complete len:1537 (+),score=298.62 gnl/MRDRNA2_/MRDRNA2_27521_c0_seq1:364-4611(+)
MTRKKIAEFGGLQHIAAKDRLKEVAKMVMDSMRDALGQKRCLGIFLKYGEEQKFLKTIDEQVIPPLEKADWAAFDGVLKKMDGRLREDANLSSKDMYFLRKRIDNLRFTLNIFQMARTKAEAQLAKMQRLLDEDPPPEITVLDHEFQMCTEIAEEAHGQVLGFTRELRKFGWGRVPACPLGHALLHHRIHELELGMGQEIPTTLPKKSSMAASLMPKKQSGGMASAFSKSNTEPTKPGFTKIGSDPPRGLQRAASMKRAQTRAFDRGNTKSLDSIKDAHAHKMSVASPKAMDAVKGFIGRTMKKQATFTEPDAGGGTGTGGGGNRTFNRQQSMADRRKSRFGGVVAAAHEIGKRVTVGKQNASYLNRFARKAIEYGAQDSSSDLGTGSASTKSQMMKKKLLCSGCDQKFVHDQKVWKCQRCFPTCFFCTKCLKGIGLQELSSLTGNVSHENELSWMASIQTLLEEPCEGWSETVQDLHHVLMMQKGSRINMAKMISKHKFVLGMLANSQKSAAVKFAAADKIEEYTTSSVSTGSYHQVRKGTIMHNQTAHRKTMVRGNTRGMEPRKTIAKATSRRELDGTKPSMAQKVHDDKPLKPALKSATSTKFAGKLVSDDDDAEGSSASDGTSSDAITASIQSTASIRRSKNRTLIEDNVNFEDLDLVKHTNRKSESRKSVAGSVLKRGHTSRIEALDDTDSSTESGDSSGSEEWEVPSSVGGLWTTKPDGSIRGQSNRLHKLQPVAGPTAGHTAGGGFSGLQPSPGVPRSRRVGVLHDIHDSSDNSRVFQDMYLSNANGEGVTQRGWSVEHHGSLASTNLRKSRPSHLRTSALSLNGLNTFVHDNVGLGMMPSVADGDEGDTDLRSSLIVHNQRGAVVPFMPSKQQVSIEGDEGDVEESGTQSLPLGLGNHSGGLSHHYSMAAYKNQTRSKLVLHQGPGRQSGYESERLRRQTGSGSEDPHGQIHDEKFDSNGSMASGPGRKRIESKSMKPPWRVDPNKDKVIFAPGDECFVYDEKTGLYQQAVIVAKHCDSDAGSPCAHGSSLSRGCQGAALPSPLGHSKVNDDHEFFEVRLADKSIVEVSQHLLSKMAETDAVTSQCKKHAAVDRNKIAEYQHAQLRRVCSLRTQRPSSEYISRDTEENTTLVNAPREIAEASSDSDLAETPSLAVQSYHLKQGTEHLSRSEQLIDGTQQSVEQPQQKEIVVAKWGLTPLPGKPPYQPRSVRCRFVDTVGHVFGTHRNEKFRMRSPCTVEDVARTICTADSLFDQADYDANAGLDWQHADFEVLATEPLGSKRYVKDNSNSDEPSFTQVVPEGNAQDIVTFSSNAEGVTKLPQGLWTSVRAMKALHRRYNCPQSDIVSCFKGQRPRKKAVRPECWRFPLSGVEDFVPRLEAVDPLDIEPIQYQESPFMQGAKLETSDA